MFLVLTDTAVYFKKEVYNSQDAFQHVYLLEVNLKWEVALLSPGCRLPSLQFPRLRG